MTATAAAPRRVDAQEAAQLHKDGWHYLDVRTPQEYQGGHAPGATNIPFMLRTDAGQ